MSRTLLLKACTAMLRHDLTLAWRRRADLALPILYALIVTTLFPFALGPDRLVLQQIAGGVVLVIVVLAMLLELNTLFREDSDDGSLEQLMLSPQPLAVLLAIKVLVYWLTSAAPLIVLSPLLAGLMHLAPRLLPVLMLSLLLATLLISLLGAILMALTITSTQRSGMLLALTLLPLCVPIVIASSGTLVAAEQGLAWVAPLAWLGAALVLALVLAPLSCAAALHIGLDG